MKYRMLYGTPLEVQTQLNDLTKEYIFAVVGYSVVNENIVSAVISIYTHI